MKEQPQADPPNSQINRNGLTPESIEAGHKLREKLLSGIQHADRDLVAEYQGDASLQFRDDQLKILN
ncbi:MAG: hypothetical protein ACJ8GL_06440, partial [Bacillus sp. (in: firmicutes)]